MRWLLTSLALLIAAPAAAQEWIVKDPKPHPDHRADVVLTLFPGWSGLGAFYVLPIVPDGFIEDVNDSFELEGGAFLEYYWFFQDDYAAISPIGGARWTFWLTPEWSVFGMVKLGFRFPLSDVNGGLAHDVGVGAYYEIDKTLSLRLQLSSHGLGAGLSFVL